MRATSPNSLLLSLTLHASFVALMFVTTYFVARQAKDSPVIFELVAGPPTAPDELVAPALGNTRNKIELPKVETVASMPDPEPVVQTQPEEKAVEPPPTEKPKPKPAKPDTSIAREMKQAARISYREYLKKHPTPKQTAAIQPRQAARGPRIDAQGIAEGVKGGSTTNTRGGGGGQALAREQQNQMDTYFSLLLQELKRAHEPPPGVSDHLSVQVTFDITASGAIMNPRIKKSSGNKEFDQSVLDAFLRVRSVGPMPNRRSHTTTVTFRMKDES